jgi:hypothetical protein
VAFYIKSIKGKAVFWAAIISEIGIITLFILNQNNVIGLSFLWLNVVGALMVVVIARVFQWMIKNKE